MKVGILSRVGEAAVHRVVGVLSWLSCVCIAALALLVSIDVTARTVLNRPVQGTVELVELGMAILVFFALAYTAAKRGHVTIPLVTSHLPERVRSILGIFTSLVGAAFFAMISWQCALSGWSQAFTMLRPHTFALYIPIFPFLLLASFGSALMSLELLVSFAGSVGLAVRK